MVPVLESHTPCSAQYSGIADEIRSHDQFIDRTRQVREERKAENSMDDAAKVIQVCTF